MQTNKETIEVNIDHYHALVEDSRLLRALEATGVDNWEGYDYAMEIYQEDEE